MNFTWYVVLFDKSNTVTRTLVFDAPNALAALVLARQAKHDDEFCGTPLPSLTTLDTWQREKMERVDE